MGACQSAYYRDIYTNKPELAQWSSDFECLMFSEADIGALYRIFRKVDNDGSGEIEVAELLAFLDIEKTKFSKRIFCMFDEDNSGEIDFREFVLSAWNYCSLGRATLMLFAFDLYDKDASGIIDQQEIGQMLKDIYGKTWEKNTYAKKILERIAEELGEDITVTEFREFVRKYPALLFPAFNLQETLQKMIMGTDFWKFFSERRMSLSDGKYIEIGEFMALHVNKGLQEKVIPDDGAGTATQNVKTVIGNTGTLAKRRSIRGVGSTPVAPLPAINYNAPAGSSSSTVNDHSGDNSSNSITLQNKPRKSSIVSDTFLPGAAGAAPGISRSGSNVPPAAGKGGGEGFNSTSVMTLNAVAKMKTKVKNSKAAAAAAAGTASAGGAPAPLSTANSSRGRKGSVMLPNDALVGGAANRGK